MTLEESNQVSELIRAVKRNVILGKISITVNVMSTAYLLTVFYQVAQSGNLWAAAAISFLLAINVFIWCWNVFW